MIWETLLTVMAVVFLVWDILLDIYIRSEEVLREKVDERELQDLRAERNSLFQASLVILGFIVTAMLVFYQQNSVPANVLGALFSGITLLFVSIITYSFSGGARKISNILQYKSVMYGLFFVLLSLTALPNLSQYSAISLIGMAYFGYRFIAFLLFSAHQERMSSEKRAEIHHEVGNALGHVCDENYVFRNFIKTSDGDILTVFNTVDIKKQNVGKTAIYSFMVGGALLLLVTAVHALSYAAG